MPNEPQTCKQTGEYVCQDCSCELLYLAENMGKLLMMKECKKSDKLGHSTKQEMKRMHIYREDNAFVLHLYLQSPSLKVKTQT